MNLITRPSLLAVGVLAMTYPLFRLMRRSRPAVSQATVSGAARSWAAAARG